MISGDVVLLPAIEELSNSGVQRGELQYRDYSWDYTDHIQERQAACKGETIPLQASTTHRLEAERRTGASKFLFVTGLHRYEINTRRAM